MSSFALRLTAIITMLLDHLGICILSLWPGSLMGTTLRTVGRISFPLFVYLIIVGSSRTRSRRAYFGRLAALAVLSQIPYSLFISRFYGLSSFSDTLKISLLPPDQWVPSAILAAVCLWCWKRYYWQGVRDKTFWWFSSALLVMVCPFVLEWGAFRLSAQEINVLYVLALTVYLASAFDKLRHKEASWLILLPAAAAFLFSPESYGAVGVCLAVALAAVPDSPQYQSMAILVWSICYYYSFYPQLGLVAVFYVLGGMAAAAMAGSFNGSAGLRLGRAFYWVYPLHFLFFIGLSFLLPRG